MSEYYSVDPEGNAEPLPADPEAFVRARYPGALILPAFGGEVEWSVIVMDGCVAHTVGRGSQTRDAWCDAACRIIWPGGGAS